MGLLTKCDGKTLKNEKKNKNNESLNLKHIDMKKHIIVHEDLRKISQLNADIEQGLPLLQLVWDHFRKCKFFDPKVELSYLILNHENLKYKYKLRVASKLTPVPSGLGIEIDEEDAIKRYKVPTPELDAAISKVRDLEVRTEINSSFFLIQDDRITINRAAVERYTNRHTIKATTDEEIKVVKAFDSFIRAATRLESLLREYDSNTIFLHRLQPIVMARFFVWDGEKYSVNPHVFKRIQKKMSQMKPEETK